MTSSITWTSREWQALAAALPAGTVSPAQIEAAQKTALPTYRHRPIFSLYGRINRAHYSAELDLARMRNEQKPLERKAKIESLRAQLAEVESALAEALRSRAADVARATVHHSVSVAETTALVESTDRVRLNRVDVVGLIGPQVSRVKRELSDEVAACVRFVDKDSLRRSRDPADFVVLVSGFVGHDAQDRYAKADRVFVQKPTVNQVVPAINLLARKKEHATNGT